MRIFPTAAAFLTLAFLAGCSGSGNGGPVIGPPPPPQPPTATYSLLHTFSGTDGANPFGLVRDESGNIYGTTINGGDLGCVDSPAGCGSVFRIDSNGILTTVHVFEGSPNDGAFPQSGLVLDEDGNLYGATQAGGNHQAGTLFVIDAAGNETILYHFTGGEDGLGPELGVRDEDGNLYGTTAGVFSIFGACSADCGTAFRWAPDGTLTVLHTFTGPDGATPLSPLVRDASGTLFGTTAHGGTQPVCVHSLGCGTVFSIDVNGQFTTLHHFAGSVDEGEVPTGRLLLEADGSLIGTTIGGGSGLGGTVYKLEPDGTLVEIHGFFGGDGNEIDDDPGGKSPEGGVIRGIAGNLYGTTHSGGDTAWGVVFELDGDTFAKRVLHTFSQAGGGGPIGPLVVDSDGNLYGTGFVGGNAVCDPAGCGIVFKVAMQLP